MKLKLVYSILLALCASSLWAVTPVSNHNKVIYEVNVRNFSQSGNFNGLKAELPRLKELGVDILWLMPVHPIGVQNRVGSKGSPYSVRDYKAVNPDYGTAADFKALVAAAHSNGMEIWIDWVANHTAWDHVWVSSHIDYYASNNGQRPYSPNGWNDVIQLDVNNQNMRAAMIDAMKYWITEFDIDGFRCDYATGLPVSFWTAVCSSVNAVKNVSWLAEGDNANYMTAFDYDYAWAFSDRLNSFGSGSNVSYLIESCEQLINNSVYSNKSRMVYLTNHDLNADHGTEFTRYGANVYPLTVLEFTIYGMPLLYNGQEVGVNKSMDLFGVSTVPWSSVNTTMRDLIKKMVDLKRTQPALEDGASKGSYKKYTTNNGNIYAYSRTKGNNEVLVLLNFSSSAVSFNFSGSAPSGEFTNYLESGTATFSTSSAVSLPAKGYKVFVKNGGTIPPQPSGATVCWKKAPGMTWTDMYLYNYVNEADAECGSWPGKRITPNADGWYSYTFTGDPGNLIWNNGSSGAGNQIDGPAGDDVNNCFQVTAAGYALTQCPASGCGQLTGMNDLVEQARFSLYPNPAGSFFSIDTDGAVASVSIRNTAGQLVWKQENNHENIDVTGLRAGVYVVETQFFDGAIRRGKLMKK
ncbi:MAG: T9SS type A sorting domain-containing protein [Dysgonamonadaceae bacterium]|jgi:glycosidase|nr:T9SS type A sorting domain-containing protein [Dysgonamonadaceae bacterium]